ncbi:hypothetical protein D3C87_1567830 [compost metagenome]
MLVVGLGACQTLVTTPSLSERLAPLDRALASKSAELEAAAASGDGEAQFGLSLVWEHGLHGYPVDMNKAAEWRARALANRRSMPITQYTAAFNGQPSRVNIINVPTYDLTPAEAMTADACIAWLTGRRAGAEACGEEADAARRRNLWNAASRR